MASMNHHGNRQQFTITEFPKINDLNITPYKENNFQLAVKSACMENKVGNMSLKICKAVLVGDIAVGKTSLVNRYCHNCFNRDYKATIGVDFEVLKFNVLSVPFNLQLWDTAGQERFKCIAASYYRGANIVIGVCDITQPETLNHAKTWIIEASDLGNNPKKFLVVTKIDLVTKDSIEANIVNAKQLAIELEAELWIVSSLTGQNVQHFFTRAVALTFNDLVKKDLDNSENLKKIEIGTNLIDMNQKNNNPSLGRHNNCC